MATKNSQPAAPSDKKTKLTIALLIVAVLVCSLAGYMTYDRYQQRQSDQRAFEADKTRFAQIEKDVEQVRAKLASKLQSGDEATITKSCDHSSAKFEEGDLMCGVYLHVTYMDKAADKFDEVRESVWSAGNFNKEKRKLFIVKDEIGKLKRSVSIYKLNPKSDFCNLDQTDYETADYILSCSHAVQEPMYTLLD